MSLPRRLWRLARHTLRSLPEEATRWFEENTHLAAERELEDSLGSAPPPREPRPPPPPPHPLAAQYATLNLAIDADAETVERAWRRLVLQHHPDRFAGDPAAERAATDRLRQINQAHDDIVAWLRDGESRRYA